MPGAHVQRHRATAVGPLAQPTRLAERDVAVGDERAEAGQPHLSAVRVTGEDHVGAEVGEAVQHPSVRCVGHADLEVGGALAAQLLERVGEGVEPVPAAVGIADAERVDAQSADVERRDAVVEVGPAEVVGEVGVERPGVERLDGRRRRATGR